MSYFTFLGICFNERGCQQVDVKLTVGEELKTYGVTKRMYNVWSMISNVFGELYEGAVILSRNVRFKSAKIKPAVCNGKQVSKHYVTGSFRSAECETRG